MTKTYQQFMEEMGAGVISTGSTHHTLIANRTGSAVSTDIPIVRKKQKKPAIVRRAIPERPKSNG